MFKEGGMLRMNNYFQRFRQIGQDGDESESDAKKGKGTLFCGGTITFFPGWNLRKGIMNFF